MVSRSVSQSTGQASISSRGPQATSNWLCLKIDMGMKFFVVFQGHQDKTIERKEDVASFGRIDVHRNGSDGVVINPEAFTDPQRLMPFRKPPRLSTLLRLNQIS